MKSGWIDDKRLKDISREKLERLKALADSTDATDRSRQLQLLSTMIKNPAGLRLNFTSGELDTLMTVLKEYASPKELALLAQGMRMLNRSV